MQTEERRAKLLEIVRQKGFASLDQLAESLDVSSSTVRRDLDALEESGVVKRTHGGVLYSGPAPTVPHFERRQRMEWDRKKQIAERAAQLVCDGDTILLDGGSTTYELALCLADRNLQVVTNSLPVATVFASRGNHDLILIGGYVHQRTGVCVGPYANQMLEHLSVRRAFLSVAGISDLGCFNSNLLLVETEQAMMRAADEVIVLADSTKFGHRSLALMCALNEIDTLIVDQDTPSEWRAKIAAADVQLLVAESTGGRDAERPETRE